MAADAVYEDLKFIEYLGGPGYKEKEECYRIFILEIEQSPKKTRSAPRTFRRLVEEHYSPINDARAYIAEELSNAWGIFTVLGDGEHDQAKREDIEAMSEKPTAARNTYNNLYQSVLQNIAATAPTINWRQSTNPRKLDKQTKWLKRAHLHFTELLNDSSNYSMKPHLEAVLLALEGAVNSITTKPDVPPALSKQQTSKVEGVAPASTATKNGSRKRLLSNDDNDGGDGRAESPAKKTKQAILPGQWWGPSKSRLNCTSAFFGIINQYRAYLANPVDPPGTLEHRVKMARFLRQALMDVNMGGKLEELLLKGEWDFRDPELKHVRSPTSIQPGAHEAHRRLGGPGWHGSNDFKRMLGGGLTAAERSAESRDAEAPGGMLSLRLSNSKQELSLRGGGLVDRVDELEQKRKDIRLGTGVLFRDPDLLWEQILEDVTYPSSQIRSRSHTYRPLMADPDRVKGVLPKFKTTMLTIPVPDQWEHIQTEDDLELLTVMAERYGKIAHDSRVEAYNFIHKNDRLFPDKPKLTDSGGRLKPKQRYGRLRDTDFVKPIAYALRARVFQVLRFKVCWKLYLSGVYPLKNVLAAERTHLEILMQHEELYMEWENNRWFSLSKKSELADLESRYAARDFVRRTWQGEVWEIDRALHHLKANPRYYDHPTAEKIKANVLPRSPTPESDSHLRAYDIAVGSFGKLAQQFGRAYIEGGVAPPVQETPVQNISRATKRKPGQFPSNSGSLPAVVEVKSSDDDDDDDNNNGDSDDNGGINRDGNNASSGTHMAGKTLYSAGSDYHVNLKTAGKKHTKDTVDVSAALEVLEKTREAYDRKLSHIIQQNNALDAEDPGNRAVIHRNNIDIMAKQQMLWSLDSEIHNMKRSTDPLSKDSYGRGAVHRWELPDSRDYLRHTRQIPRKQELPLGITTLGPGPMPGEHPSPGHPRFFVGAPEDFGMTLDDDVEMADPAGDLFGSVPETDAAAMSSAPPAGHPDGAKGPPATAAAYTATAKATKQAKTPSVTGVEPFYPAANEKELKEAADNVTKYRTIYQGASRKYDEAASDAERAEGAALMAIGDAELRRMALDAGDRLAAAERAHEDAELGLRIAAQGLRAQQTWASSPAETHDRLRARCAALAGDFAAWRRGFRWDVHEEATPRRAADQWVMEAAALMHEAYKAVGVNVGPRYWFEMHATFWAVKGRTLARRRALWLHALVLDLNARLAHFDPPVEPFLPVPSPPPPASPFSEGEASPTKDELLRQEAMAQTAASRPEPITAPPLSYFGQRPAVTETTYPTPALAPTPPHSAGPPKTARRARQDGMQEEPSGGLGASADEDGQTNDAWPDLKDLIQSNWNAILAHEVLQQREGEVARVPGGRPSWPRPVRKYKGDEEYYSL
ncbi:hypothetical protein F4802DRAFT_618372 [Xylaria palmicola]|nr:hypothetical protein F4802DRAFT_618372 [Xylaria palmicola]